MKKKLWITLTAALLLAAFVCGCAAQAPKSSASYDRAYDTAMSAEEAGYEMPVAEPEMYDGEGIATSNQSSQLTGEQAEALSGRKIIETAYLHVQTLEFDTFLGNLNRAVAEYGGYIETSDIGGRNYYNEKQLRYAYIVLRIPNEKLKAFKALVSDIGNVTSTSTNTEDVTLSYVDTESRLAAYRTEQQTLLSLLEKAEKMEDVLAIQSQLTQVRAEIESYESILRTFDNRINYSTVTIDLNEVERETAVVEETPGEEIARKFRESLEDVGEGFVDFGVWFIGNLPEIIVWIVILGGVTVVIVLICRGGKKRRERRAAKRAQRLAKRAEALKAQSPAVTEPQPPETK